MVHPPVSYSEVSKSLQLSEIQDEVQRLKEVTSGVPAMALHEAEAMEKAWRTMSKDQPARGPKAAFFDPLSLQYALGYKDRRYSLTYDTLKRIAQQLSIVASIVSTRVAQIASFAQPYRQSKSLGFVIKHKDTEHETTRSERKFIQELESFVANCGEPGLTNPYFRHPRDDFEGFLKKIVRDTLVYDQVAFEIVPRENFIPFEFWAVDASTIRIASSDKDVGINWSYHDRNTLGNMRPYRFQGLYDQQRYGSRDTLQGEAVQYVQVINGQIENVYTNRELAFGIRNPRTDIYVQGYGYGEMEQMVTIITGLLYAEEYNRRYFTQGAHPKGLLNFKGDNWTPDQLEAFKRQWISSVSGTENAWKTPITQSEGIEWINLQMSNREMEFRSWIEYLIKIICGVYLIDPAEINFDLHGGVQQTPLFESSQEWKLKASRDRGLRPLLKFIAKMINRNIIDKIDDHFSFEFVGLDELTEQEKHEMLKEQIGSYMTLNEGRRALDLPDIELGDVPMSPIYLQLLQLENQKQQQEEQKKQQEEQMKQQQEMQEQQMGQQKQMAPSEQDQQGAEGQQPAAGGQPAGAEEQPAVGEEGQMVEGETGKPEYTANFGKSKEAENVIVVKFDDWIDQKRSV